MMTDADWDELYRRGSEYAANRISELYRDDAIQNGLCRVLQVVRDKPPNLPTDPEQRLKYLTACMCNEIRLMAPQDKPGQTPRLPTVPTL